MAPADPHQGGDLFDMMNIIPSKPRPGESASDGPTNPTDIPRSFQDQGSNALPSEINSKRLHHFGNEDQAKGSARYDKHVRQKETDQDKYATEGSDVDLQPSEEERMAKTDRPDEEMERIIDSRERRET
ncbi:hypothetical protein N431DRAFT_546408 [Stipitochalara longipes BDJ]|nr:hypothetical protein N431DRAFT_546408 [Stipitochalara longipes BDJ]